MPSGSEVLGTKRLRLLHEALDWGKRWATVEKEDPIMVLTVFRSRLRPGVEEEYKALAGQLFTLAQAIPGFVSLESFQARDGEQLSLVRFADRAAHEQWQRHPEHLAAKRLGRERFYSTFEIFVCEDPEHRLFPGT